MIAGMKWKLYAKGIYWEEFFFLILLMIVFLTEIFWLHYNEAAENTKLIVGNTFHSIMALILYIFIKTELR